MTASVISKQFNIPLSTVYYLAYHGQIPFNEAPRGVWVKKRRLLFDPAEVKAALDRMGQP